MGVLTQGGIDVSVVATGSDFSGAANQSYYWSALQCQAEVWNHPSSGVTLYVLFNDAETPAVTADNWDAVLEPGDPVVWAHNVTRIGIRSTGAATLGTDFAVRGWL